MYLKYIIYAVIEIWLITKSYLSDICRCSLEGVAVLPLRTRYSKRKLYSDIVAVLNPAYTHFFCEYNLFLNIYHIFE